MGFFSKLFGSKKSGKATEEPEAVLRDYIQTHLPESYTRSKKFRLDIQPGNPAKVRIALDMEADGSDYKGFSQEDFENLAELEAGYLLSEKIADPPVPANFSLDMMFPGRTIPVQL